MTLTTRGEQTRARIVAGAAAEIREFGVDAVRLEDVLARTSASKSQLFHYFPGGKEDLLIAVAQHEADQVLFDQQPALGSLTSWQAWEDWRSLVLRRYREQGQHCPLNALLDRITTRSPAAQAVVAELMRRWAGELATGIRALQAAREIDPLLDADHVAEGIVAAVQGGVLMLMATGRMGPLEAALDQAIGNLRKTPA